MQHSTRKLNMIESQLRPNKIIDENLIAAFQKVHQEDFLPDSLKNLSYQDGLLNIPHFMADYTKDMIKLTPTKNGLLVWAGSTIFLKEECPIWRHSSR